MTHSARAERARGWRGERGGVGSLAPAALAAFGVGGGMDIHRIVGAVVYTQCLPFCKHKESLMNLNVLFHMKCMATWSESKC
jgi:hypothetical protein